MRPYLETLFRAPYLLLLPALLLPAAVFFGTRALPDSYDVKATLWVDAPAPTSATVLQTASGLEATNLSARLSTIAFRKQVLTDAGLAEKVEAYQWPPTEGIAALLAKSSLTKPLADKLAGKTPTTADAAWTKATKALGGSLHVEAKGSNLVYVSYSGSDPATGQALVQAAVTDYLAERAAANQRTLDEAQHVLDPVITQLQTEVDAAHKAYLDAAAALPLTPVPASTARTEDLLFTYTKAVERLQDAQLKRASSGLTALTDPTTRSTYVRLVDAPAVPTKPSFGLRAALLVTILAGCLGLMLGAGLVVLRTWLDRGLRSAEDVGSRLDATVIGVVPLLRYDTRKKTGS